MIMFLFKACVAAVLAAILLGIVAITVAGGFLLYQQYKDWKEDFDK